MAEIKGIDVSKWQGTIDWAKVKADGIKFAILRAGYGRLASQKDVKFEEYYKGAKAAGLDVGVYWYSYATTAEDAKAEAEACYECIKGKSLEYPVFFDYEDTCQRTSAIASAIIPAFIDTMNSKGYYTDLYSYKNLLETVVPADIKKRYGIWLAHYTSKTSFTGHKMWQYSSTGKVNGISGNVDMNICYVDYPALIKASKPSTSKPVTETAKPTTSNKNTTISKGDKVTLSNASLYSSASSTTVAGTKTGTYYVYNGEKIGTRYAITNSSSNVGKTPMGNYVTGWVEASAIGEGSTATSTKTTFSKGDKVTLSNAKLYGSASGGSAAGTKTGTYYVYNGEKIGTRYAITNSSSNVGKTPMGNYVTGWVEASDLK